MAPATTTEALDRHVLVMTIWLTTALIAATLFHYGVGEGGPLFILAAFAAIIAAFAVHVIINIVVGGDFTTREDFLAAARDPARRRSSQARCDRPRPVSGRT